MQENIQVVESALPPMKDLYVAPVPGALQQFQASHVTCKQATALLHVGLSLHVV